MKKRLILILCLIAGPAGLSVAHTLPGDEGPAVQLAHQFLSLHHLPVVLLILVAVFVLCRKGIAALRR
jgi:hypothetical protein